MLIPLPTNHLGASFLPQVRRPLLFFATIFLLASGSFGHTQTALAEISVEQQKQLDSVVEELEKFPSLFRGKKYPQAATQIEKIQTSIEKLSKGEPDEQLQEELDLLRRRVEAATRLLTSKGVFPGGGGVSFVKQVAPLLVRECGNCHITRTQGRFSMATYPDLMRGTPDGVVFQPGKGKGSRLIDILETGDMPRGRSPMSVEQIAMLTSWIDQGAKFDGPNPAATLVSLVPNATMPENTDLKVIPSTGKESVLFNRDLAPVIVESCLECHGGDQPAANRSLETFSALLRAGQNGNLIVPGKPADSLLVKKLRGTAERGVRMPFQRDPLPEETIVKFEKWIADGAKFDGDAPDQDLERTVKMMIAAKMSHEELATSRHQLAQSNWRLAHPNLTAQELETEHFFLLGNVSPARLAEVAELAKDQWVRVAKILGEKPGNQIVKGRMTLYLFEKRFEYTELGRMVEKRELPPDWNGHWRYDVIDSYGSLLLPKDEKDFSLSRQLAELIAGTYIEAQGKSPSWFHQGSARAISAKVVNKDPLVRQWEESLPQAFANLKTPEDFLTNDASSGEMVPLCYSFAQFLMSDMPRYEAVLNSLEKGEPFAPAFQKAYGGDPKLLLPAWVKASWRK